MSSETCKLHLGRNLTIPQPLTSWKFEEFEGPIHESGNCPPIHPVPKDQEVSFTLPEVDGAVEMAENDRVEALRIAGPGQTLPEVLVADRGARRVVAARVGAGSSQGDAEVGMDPAKEAARDPVPEHALQDLVTAVPRSKPVPVGEKDEYIERAIRNISPYLD